LYSAIKSEDAEALHGGIRLRLSEQMGLEVSFEDVHSTAGSNVGR